MTISERSDKVGPLTADDRQQIQEAIHRYAWALDTGDVEGLQACFTVDGVLVWDAFEVPYEWRGSDELGTFAAFLRDLATTAGRQHHVSNIIIEGDASAARARSYVAVMLRQGGGPHAITVMGWYEDELKPTSKGWRIAHRTIRDWSGAVLSALAGQTGEREARARPAALAGMGGRPLS